MATTLYRPFFMSYWHICAQTALKLRKNELISRYLNES